MSNCIKRYKLSLRDKTKILFQNYESGTPIIETLQNAKFDTIDEFANRLSYCTDRERKTDFLFELKLEPETIEPLKDYLRKQKKFIYDYTTSRTEFLDSPIYQLLLQYIPNELTDMEKNMFLDSYINMITSSRGRGISEERRKKLEKRLNINQN